MLTLVDYALFEALPFGFMAIGLVLTVRYLKLIDLTFAASFALGPAVLARLLVDGHGFVSAFAAATALIILLSLLTLFLLLALRVDGLLAGLISSFAGYALALLFTRGSLSFSGIDTPLTPLIRLDMHWFSGRAPLHPWQIIAFGTACIVVKKAVDLFLHSEAGLAYRALEDEKSARNLLPSLRITPDRLIAAGIVAGNLLCMASGIAVALKETQATAQRGFDALLTVVAGYLLGVTIFERRPPSTISATRNTFVRFVIRVQRLEATSAALVGLLIYFLLLQSISRLDVPSSVPKLIIVAILVASFTASRWSELRARILGTTNDITVPAPQNKALIAENVDVSYPAFPEPIHVLEGASIEVAPGELLLVTGRNGAGKSTFLRYLAGEIGGRGRVAISGITEVGNGASRRAAVALIRQDSGAATCATLTAREHVVLYLKGRNASIIRRWSRVDLDSWPALRRIVSFGDVPVACLSGGQRQVLNVTSLIVRPDTPRIVLFDEPLTHLDEQNAQVCVELIDDLLQLGCAVVLVQHDLDPTPGLERRLGYGTRAQLAAMVKRRIDISEIGSRLAREVAS